VKQCGVHVMYEYDVAYRPHASSYLRLLRPLSYPTLAGTVGLSHGLRYDQVDADVVVVDRLWRPDVDPIVVERLITAVRRSGAKLVHSLDDNLMDLPPRQIPVGSAEVIWPQERHRASMGLLLAEADAVWVTTPNLRDRFSSYNRAISILPNALDDRLLVRPPTSTYPETEARRNLVIGYMGTRTHDEDLKMIVPAIRAICSRYPGLVSVEVIGVMQRSETRQHLSDLPVHYVSPYLVEHEYPYFVLWFSRSIRWDVAVAPLQSNEFNDSKSDIKFLDYAAIGAATICSKVPAYESTVRHGETGLLVENDVDAWVHAIDSLVTDADLRCRLSRGAVSYLYGERTLDVCASAWTHSLHSVLGGHLE
jgi:processive 1,2-diacylglycerol beta-glucosyltransferase